MSSKKSWVRLKGQCQVRMARSSGNVKCGLGQVKMAGSGWNGNIKLKWLGLGQLGRPMSSENG